MTITPDKIRDLWTSRKRFYQAQRTEQALDQSYYEDTFETGIKAPFHELRTGRGRIAVDSACDQITFTNPTATREPRNLTMKEQSLQDEIEHWCNGLLNRWSLDDPNPYRESVKNCGAFGECYSRLVLNEEEDSFPIGVYVYDPQIVYPSPGITLGKLDDLIVAYRRTVGDIEAEYPEWKPKQAYQPDAEVDWLEYHAPGLWYAEADNISVTKNGEVTKTLFPFLPWSHVYSGYGRYSGAGHPETLARSLLYGMRGMVRAETRWVSMLDSIIGLWTFPRVFTTALPEDMKLDLSAGKQNHIPREHWESTKIDQGVAPHPALFQYGGVLQSLLQEYSPATLRGQAAPSVESGYGQSVVTGMARIRYGPLLAAVNRLWSNTMALSIRTVEEVLKTPVPVTTAITDDKGRNYGKEIVLDPDDIQRFWLVTVKMESADPEATDRRKALGSQLRQAGHISMRTMLQDYFSMPNATDEIAQIMAEKIVEESPAVKEQIERRVLQKLGLDDMVDAEKVAADREQEMSQMLSQAQMMPRPGVPPNIARPDGYQKARQIVSQYRKRVPTPVGQAGIPMGPMSTRPEMAPRRM